MRGSLRLALLSPLVLLAALPPPPEEDELQARLRERLRVADLPDPALLPHPEEPPLRRPEERLPAPLPIIALQAPPAPPERYCCYSHLISPHRGKRRRRWPEEPAGGANKNQRQHRRDARRNGRP